MASIYLSITMASTCTTHDIREYRYSTVTPGDVRDDVRVVCGV